MDQKVSMLTAENTRLIQERESLIADLEECKSELFKRMPPSQISDDSIQKAYRRIHQSIDSFVFDIMSDEVVDDALYILCQKEQRLQKQKTRKTRNSLSKYISSAEISAWGPYECSNLYILSVIIQWILDEFIFGESYPIGVPEEQIRTIEEVAKGIGKSMWRASEAGS